ncbi:oxidoreductase-like domain-containing protein [Neisseria sp. Ec49-e6-T10]|uniref:oxidoreductase-like domain-containing protein n=1 Tax=Neisseria sp. Ec49-e6-T10 TaxID=3140744 RepID=UPI003EBBF74B
MAPQTVLLDPPVPPQENECCGNGCDDCVWTVYYAALQVYQAKLAKQQAQQESKKTDAD